MIILKKTIEMIPVSNEHPLVGTNVEYDGLPYKVLSKHRGLIGFYYVLEPIHESHIIRCAVRRVFEKDLIYENPKEDKQWKQITEKLK